MNQDKELTELDRVRPSSPLDEEQSIGSGDAGSVVSIGSAVMANFGRSPSPVRFYLNSLL